MIEDAELLSISALPHYIYCQRRCALIHIEQIWVENRFTAEGRVMHEHVHKEQSETRGVLRAEHAVALRSLKLGLAGVADTVEYHKVTDGVVPFPVEHKRGKPKVDDCDKVQLCAQAMCLEEMLKLSVPEGAIYYGRTRRRLDVLFDEQLRQTTIDLAEKLHTFIAAGITPPPVYEKKCDTCSLLELCLPKTITEKNLVQTYYAKMLADR